MSIDTVNKTLVQQYVPLHTSSDNVEGIEFAAKRAGVRVIQRSKMI